MAISFVRFSSGMLLYAGLISSLPSAIRESIAGCPFLLLEFSRYFRSNSNHGTSLLSRIQSFFGSSDNEPNISVISSMDTCPVCRLYIPSPPQGASSSRISRVFPCTYYTMNRAQGLVFSLLLAVCRRHGLGACRNSSFLW